MSTSAVLLSIALMMSVIAKAADRDPVRVRLAGPSQALKLEGQNLWIFSGKGEVVLSAKGFSQLSLHFDKQKQAFFLELKENTKTLVRRELKSEFFPLRFEWASARLFRDKDHDRIPVKNIPERFEVSRTLGLIEAVATVPFSEYLLGVLHREMPGAWPLEALKAQAVATRSYTLAQMKDRKAQSFDLDASVMDQEFEYIPEAGRKSEIYRRWAEALKTTDSTVLLNAKSEVLKAYYHADCGGRTTTPDFVWGPVGEYKSVRDPSCERRAQNQWKMVAKKSWLREKLRGEDLRSPAATKAASSVAQAGAQLLKFDWIQSLFDQRVTLVEWWDGIGDLQILSGQNFRQILGFGELRSLRFETKDLGDAVEFKGRGFGHGVGLCQWGSKDWAEQGLHSDQILRHYYPLARLGRK